jgi:hypothetical protein
MKQIQVMKHSPTLNTILMVEDVLRNANEIISLAELKRRLPKKIMHQTLLGIVDYLLLSGKVIIGTKGILWIYTPRNELNALASNGREL